MKLFLKRMLPALLALLMAFSLVSCGPGQGSQNPDQNGTDSGSGEENKPPVQSDLNLVTAGQSEFVIVYPEGAGDDLMTGVKKLKDNIKSYTGAKLKDKDDYLGHSDTEATYEILIGETNRAESQKWVGKLRNSEYVVMVDGTKLVLFGPTEADCASAVNYFIKYILKKTEGLSQGCTDGTLVVSAEQNYQKPGDFYIRFIHLDGIPLESCRIVVPAKGSAESYFAKMLQVHLRVYAGYIIPIVTDAEPAQDGEIVFGQTNRTTVSAKTGKYRIEVTDKKMEIVSDTILGYSDAHYMLTNLFFSQLNEEISLKPGDMREGDATPAPDATNAGNLRIMYHNVWGYQVDPNSYGWYPVADRANMMLAVYQTYLPDILGMQEAGASFRKKPESQKLYDWLAENYVEIVFHNDRGTGNPIYYRKDSGLTLLESGYNRARANDKGTTWAVFSTADGIKFAVTNSHYEANSNANNDNETGNQYRLASANVTIDVANMIKQKYGNIAVFTGGDLNSNPSSAAYRALISAGYVNVREMTNVKTNYSPHHAHPSYSEKWDMYTTVVSLSARVDQAIDHALYLGDASKVTIHRYIVADDMLALTSSDHAPHFIDVTLK